MIKCYERNCKENALALCKIINNHGYYDYYCVKHYDQVIKELGDNLARVRTKLGLS